MSKSYEYTVRSWLYVSPLKGETPDARRVKGGVFFLPPFDATAPLPPAQRNGSKLREISLNVECGSVATALISRSGASTTNGVCAVQASTLLQIKALPRRKQALLVDASNTCIYESASTACALQKEERIA